MTNIEQDRWSRVKGRLRTSVGEDVYTSWFARMDLEGVQDESVRLSVPTRFLKSWIQAHYAERVLSAWQAEMPEVHRIDLTVRSAMRSVTPAKEAAAPVEARRPERHDARRLAARSAPDLCELCRRPLQHAGACRRASGRRRTPRRSRDVQPALHSCRRRPRQDASPA